MLELVLVLGEGLLVEEMEERRAGKEGFQLGSFEVFCYLVVYLLF